MINNKTMTGHIFAFITILFWGMTFISTKILLTDFKPIEILFFRFFIGLIALSLAYPHRLKIKNKKEELTFIAAGLCGVSLYFLLENIALTYTMASNVGVIISIAPFFTALLSHFFMKGEEKLHVNFFAGFCAAMAGIILISLNGSKLKLNPAGDILAILAAFVWACYSILTKKISSFGYPTIQTTRRVFFYGLVLMLPVLHPFGFQLNLTRFSEPLYLFNILFLGLGASAICFVSWNFAVKILGAVKTSVYIYLDPVITIIASALILHEKVNLMSIAGTLLALTGLIISEKRRT